MNQFFDLLTYCLRETKSGRILIPFIVGFIIGKILLSIIMSML